MRDLTDVTSGRDIRETTPSMNLAVAGALARAGWPPDRIAETLNLPHAFAELVCDSAVRDGEPRPGDDARLIAALTRKFEQRRRQQRTNLRLSQVPVRPRASRGVSPSLLAWNLGVLLLSVAGHFIPDLPSPLRGLLLGAALIGLVLTSRQAARILRATPPPRHPGTDL